MKKSKSQPFIAIEQFGALERQIARPRDRILLRILFLCVLRRSELFVLKWKDFNEEDQRFTMNIERSFCSRTHKVKEWAGKQANGQGKAVAKVAVPPELAGAKIGLPEITYHWFRRGHATVQHHHAVADKPIQGQLRHSRVETTRNIYMQQVAPETWKAVVALEKLISMTMGERADA